MDKSKRLRYLCKTENSESVDPPTDDNIFSRARPLTRDKKMPAYNIVGHGQVKLKQLDDSIFFPTIKHSSFLDNINHSTCSNAVMSTDSRLERSKYFSITAEMQMAQDRDKRHMVRYDYYKNLWEKRKIKIPKKAIDSVRVYVENNPQKQEVVKENPSLFWQRSIRNNCKLVLRHIKGAPYSECEVGEKLQTQKGTREVEGSMPPRLTNKDQGFILEGRAGLHRAAGTISNRQRNSFSVEEVLKSDWKPGFSKLYK